MFTAESPNVVPHAAPAGHGRVRGAVIQLHVEWLRHYGSRDDVIEMFESLEASIRHQVLAAQPAQWCRFTTLLDLQAAIADRFGRGEHRFHEQIGAFAAQSQLVPLREFLDRSRLHDFFGTTAVLHRDTLDFGSSDYEVFGEDSGRMIVTQLGGAPSYRAFLTGYYRDTVAMHGGSDATVREVAAGIFDICWR